MSNDQHLTVVALSGSLRKGSYNTALVRAAKELAPEGLSIGLADISRFPLYNADIQAEGFPQPVELLGGEIAAADAVLFATPEYNYSVPGVLKNAIDWLSRLPSQPFKGKPVGIVGASVGLIGTARAQYHLRQMCVFLDAVVMNKPEVFVMTAKSRFDESGTLTDADSRKFLSDFLSAFKGWIPKAKMLSR